MIAIVNYGVGNLFSLSSSLNALGFETVVTGSKDILKKSGKIILPGVGAFGDAADKLKSEGLDEFLINEAKNKKPLLGICLGMQLLFDKSYEYGIHSGLGLIKGCVRPIKDVCDKSLKIPHIGWNRLDLTNPPHPLFKHIKNGDYVYFVHSYYASDCSESTIAVTDYSAPLTAAVANKNVIGCQFHPEKSGRVGLEILRAFCETEEF